MVSPSNFRTYYYGAYRTFGLLLLIMFLIIVSSSAQSSKDPYKVLGLPRSASEQQIKKKYRQMARKYHPDLNKGGPGVKEKFQAINKAYEILGDADKRQQYDLYGDTSDIAGGGGGGSPFFRQHNDPHNHHGGGNPGGNRHGYGGQGFPNSFHSGPYTGTHFDASYQFQQAPQRPQQEPKKAKSSFSMESLFGNSVFGDLSDSSTGGSNNHAHTSKETNDKNKNKYKNKKKMSKESEPVRKSFMESMFGGMGGGAPSPDDGGTRPPFARSDSSGSFDTSSPHRRKSSQSSSKKEKTGQSTDAQYVPTNVRSRSQQKQSSSSRDPRNKNNNDNVNNPDERAKQFGGSGPTYDDYDPSKSYESFDPSSKPSFTQKPSREDMHQFNSMFDDGDGDGRPPPEMFQGKSGPGDGGTDQFNEWFNKKFGSGPSFHSDPQSGWGPSKKDKKKGGNVKKPSSSSKPNAATSSSQSHDPREKHSNDHIKHDFSMKTPSTGTVLQFSEKSMAKHCLKTKHSCVILFSASTSLLSSASAVFQKTAAKSPDRQLYFVPHRNVTSAMSSLWSWLGVHQDSVTSLPSCSPYQSPSAGGGPSQRAQQLVGEYCVVVLSGSKKRASVVGKYAGCQQEHADTSSDVFTAASHHATQQCQKEKILRSSIRSDNDLDKALQLLNEERESGTFTHWLIIES